MSVHEKVFNSHRKMFFESNLETLTSFLVYVIQQAVNPRF